MFVISGRTYLLKTILLFTQYIFFEFQRTQYVEQEASRFQTHRHVIKQFNSPNTCNDTNYHTQFCDTSTYMFPVITKWSALTCTYYRV